MRLTLVPHPGFPPKLVRDVKVQIEWHEQRAIWLEYCVYGAEALVLPAPAEPRRADELWKTTCFELFCTKPDREGYFEFNFSPSFEWAAYAFNGYRSGQRELPAQPPEIEISSELGEHFFLAAEPWPPDLVCDAAKLALSAVIEEKDGTKSYWALIHPDQEKPDFHHPDGFILELPALA